MYWPDKQDKSAWEKLDSLGPLALYHNEHRLESCVTGHVYYNRTHPPGPPTHYDTTTRMHVYMMILLSMYTAICSPFCIMPA